MVETYWEALKRMYKNPGLPIDCSLRSCDKPGCHYCKIRKEKHRKWMRQFELDQKLINRKHYQRKSVSGSADSADSG